MEITTGPLDWTTNDEQLWAAFLDSNTGRRLIPKFLESTPTLLDRGDINAILIRTGEVRGMQLAVNTLLVLAHPPAPQAAPSIAYPAPENDAHWNDGQKLVLPPKPE